MTVTQTDLDKVARIPVQAYKTEDEYFRDALKVLTPPIPENCQHCRQTDCDFCPHEPLARVMALLMTRDRLLTRLFKAEAALAARRPRRGSFD